LIFNPTKNKEDHPLKKTVIRVFALLLVFSMLFGCAPMAEVSSEPEAESVPVSSDSISAEVSSAAQSAQSPAVISSKNTSSTAFEEEDEDEFEEEDEPEERVEEVRLSNSPEQEFSTAITNFGLKMMAQMPRDGKSTVLSPVSLAVPLSLLANGARGQSYDELAAVLGIEDITEYNEQFAAYQEFLNENSEFISSTEERNERSYLKYGSSIWVENNFPLNPNFSNINDLYYSAKLTSLDFYYSSAAAQRINEWVLEMTEGKVQDLVKKDDIEGSCMIIINTIFFNFTWQTKYLWVSEREFLTYDGKTVTAGFLHSDELTRYIKGENVRGFKQSYFGNQYYFAALLPDEGIDIYDYAASLTGEELQEIFKSESDHELDIRFPRFIIKNSIDCKDLLQKAGVNSIFYGGIDGLMEDEANSTSKLLYISKILQDAGIELNESGTAACAATMMTVAMGGPQDPIELNFDRPFLYVIADEEYDIPLFIGIVAAVEPAVEE